MRASNGSDHGGLPGAPLLRWFNVNPNVGKWSHAQ